MSILAPWTASGGWLSPEIYMVISAIAHLGRAEDRQVLLHLTISLSSRQTAHRRLSGAHRDRSQSHRQWLAVTAPAGRAYAVERVRPTCRAAPRCCQTKQVPKKGVEGRRREARRRPKKLRFISRGQKALAHPSLLPLKKRMVVLHFVHVYRTVLYGTYVRGFRLYCTPSPRILEYCTVTAFCVAEAGARGGRVPCVPG